MVGNQPFSSFFKAGFLGCLRLYESLGHGHSSRIPKPFAHRKHGTSARNRQEIEDLDLTSIDAFAYVLLAKLGSFKPLAFLFSLKTGKWAMSFSDTSQLVVLIRGLGISSPGSCRG